MTQKLTQSKTYLINGATKVFELGQRVRIGPAVSPLDFGYIVRLGKRVAVRVDVIDSERRFGAHEIFPITEE